MTTTMAAMLKLYGYTQELGKKCVPGQQSSSAYVRPYRKTMGMRGERERGNGCADERAIVDERTDERTNEGANDERASE
jgi:hypothetical protein